MSHTTAINALTELAKHDLHAAHTGLRDLLTSLDQQIYATNHRAAALRHLSPAVSEDAAEELRSMYTKLEDEVGELHNTIQRVLFEANRIENTYTDTETQKRLATALG